MKRIITLVILLQSLLSTAQNLTLDELITLRKKNIADVEEYLSNKNWAFHRSTKPEIFNLGELVFTYKKSNFDDSAESFIKYFYSDASDRKRLAIQINVKEKYTTYLNKVKSLGCKLIDTKVDEGIIKKIYQGKSTTFIFSIGTNKEEFSMSTSTIYGLYILDNSDYNQNFSFDSSSYDNETIVDTVAAPVYEDYNAVYSYIDSDGDGIGDDKDKCPNVKGTFFNDGCPEVSDEAVKRLNNYEKTIYFSSQKSSFNFATFSVLKNVVAILKEYPNSNFILEGYTDDSETNDFYTLSKDRAQAVKNYLIDNGIEYDRLRIIGLGKTKPAASNKTEKGREKNRRVVIKLEN